MFRIGAQRKISTSIHWLLAAVLFVMLNILDSSAEMAWLSVIVVFLPLSGIVYLRYRSGHWRNIKVIEPDREATFSY